ncbi:MAG: ABC-F family ATP-binding cassette domain-containing protein [Bacilli bacterium]|nr:ABC-F family ATP-binding cassette domain-containing protein [Bacilli bacterium]
MAILEAIDVTFDYGDKPLLSGASLKVNPGEHCALVGINGSGKSTMFQLLIGDLRPDKGEIRWEPHTTYAYLDQQMHVDMNVRAVEYFYGVYTDLFEKEKEMESLYLQAASGEAGYEKLLNRAERIGDELMEKDFYSLQSKVGSVVDGLGFSAEDLEKPMGLLSPGMREKAFLGKMLLEEKQVLLMDEPTNFLDPTQVAFLTQYLKNYPKAFLLISHDEAFLNDVADVIFYLRAGRISRYSGGYAHFLVQKEIDLAQAEKNYQAQQRYIKKEEAFIAAHIVRATSAKAAKSRRARLEHLERLDAPSKEGGEVHFRFPYSKGTGRIALTVKDLEIGYDHALLSPINLEIPSGSKVALLGHNGVGKTTFIRTILSQIPPLSGNFYFHENVDCLYFEQMVSIDLDMTPFEYIRSLYPDFDNTRVRSLLASVGVKNETAMRRLRELSGGEAAKTKLVPLTVEKSNFLLLDEPTNHLDKKAKDALFEAIEEFPGTVILVCHEKDFADGLVDYEIRFN